MNGWADTMCDTADEGAAIGLLALMTGLSEEHWCAGWLDGLEFSLWHVKPETRFGQGVITGRQATLLHLLSQEAGGWWAWSKARGKPEFITLEEWVTRDGVEP